LLLRQGMETFQLKRFCKLVLLKMLPFTTDEDVVLGGVDMALPGDAPVGLVALIRSGELPDWVVPGRKNVPDQSRVEFHKAKFQFGLAVVPKFDITYLSCLTHWTLYYCTRRNAGNVEQLVSCVCVKDAGKVVGA